MIASSSNRTSLFSKLQLLSTLEEKYNGFIKSYKIKANKDNNQVASAHSIINEAKFPVISSRTHIKKIRDSHKSLIKQGDNKILKYVLDKKVKEIKQLSSGPKINISDEIAKRNDESFNQKDNEDNFLMAIDNTILMKTQDQLKKKLKTIEPVKMNKQNFSPEEQYKKLVNRFKMKIQQQLSGNNFVIIKESGQKIMQNRNKFSLLKHLGQNIQNSHQNYIPKMFSQILKSNHQKKEVDENKFLSTINKKRVKRILLMNIKHSKQKVSRQDLSTIACSLPSIP